MKTVQEIDWVDFKNQVADITGYRESCLLFSKITFDLLTHKGFTPRYITSWPLHGPISNAQLEKDHAEFHPNNAATLGEFTRKKSADDRTIPNFRGHLVVVCNDILIDLTPKREDIRAINSIGYFLCPEVVVTPFNSEFVRFDVPGLNIYYRFYSNVTSFYQSSEFSDETTSKEIQRLAMALAEHY